MRITVPSLLPTRSLFRNLLLSLAPVRRLATLRTSRLPVGEPAPGTLMAVTRHSRSSPAASETRFAVIPPLPEVDVRTEVVTRPINAAKLLAEVSSVSNGATILFVGSVRDVNEGRSVAGIEYSAYAGMAERELGAVVAEAAERFGTQHIVLEHRTGQLHSAMSPSFRVAHPRRAGASLLHIIIEELKRGSI